MTLRILHWLCRIILAVIFIYSGYIKAQETLQFAVAIMGYKVVPESLVFPIAKYFPWFEIALGLLLLIGWKIRYVSVGATGLLLFFMVLLASTLFRGIETNCGCFGFGERISYKTIARDSLMLIPALFLVVETRLRLRPKDTVLTSANQAPSTEN